MGTPNYLVKSGKQPVSIDHPIKRLGQSTLVFIPVLMSPAVSRVCADIGDIGPPTECSYKMLIKLSHATMSGSIYHMFSAIISSGGPLRLVAGIVWVEGAFCRPVPVWGPGRPFPQQNLGSDLLNGK